MAVGSERNCTENPFAKPTAEDDSTSIPEITDVIFVVNELVALSPPHTVDSSGR